MKPDPRLCLALDVATATEAETWVRRTASVFGTFKIGLQLFCAEGPDIIRRVRVAGAQRIFLDLKLHDIPNTVAGAVRSLTRAGVDDLTVHLAGGPAMLRAAAEAAEASGLKLLGVSVLTSLDRASLTATGVDRAVGELVLDRARLARDCGIGGLVCSAGELTAVRRAVGSTLELVTPGIRLADGNSGDQKRVADPARALADGADRLVIGRAITAATDTGRAIDRLRSACGARPDAA